MNVFKRAWLYVTRKRGKTALLFAILLIMATFVLTGLSIWKASEAAQLDLRQSLGGKFEVFVDWSNSPYVARETIQDNEVDGETGKTTSSFLMYSTVQFTPENIAAIKSISGVKYCSARQDNLLPFDGLSLFPGTIAIDAKYQGYTKALGVCNTKDDELFTTGTLTLADGRHISDGDTHVAIISQDLAERNELKIGDYLTAHCYSVEDQGFTGQEIKVQIMLTFEKVLEIFGDYLAQDKACEVLTTSRGIMVVDWESCKNNWVTSQLCPTPEKLLDVLRSSYEEYQGYCLTDGYKRDLTDQEEQDIERMGAELAARCEES